MFYLKLNADSEFLVHFSVGLHFWLFGPCGFGPIIGIPMTYNTTSTRYL